MVCSDALYLGSSVFCQANKCVLSSLNRVQHASMPAISLKKMKTELQAGDYLYCVMQTQGKN